MTTPIATTPNPIPTSTRSADPAHAGAGSASTRGFNALLALGIPTIGDTQDGIGTEGGVAPRSTIMNEVGRELNDAAQVRLDELAGRELESPGAPDPLARPVETPEHLRPPGPQDPNPSPARDAPHTTRSDAAPAPKSKPSPPSPPSAPGVGARVSADHGAASQAPIAGGAGSAQGTVPTARAGEASMRIGAAGAASRVSSLGVTQGSGSGASSGNPHSGAGGAEARARVLRSLPAQRPGGADGALRSRVLSQVQRALGSIMNHKGGSLTLKLSPNELGEVRVRIDASGGAVKARFEAQRDTARAILEEGLTTLRAALESRGVRVESLTLEPDPGAVRHAQAAPVHEPTRGSDADTRREGRRKRDAHGGARVDTDHDDQDPATHPRAGVWTEFGLDTIA